MSDSILVVVKGGNNSTITGKEWERRVGKEMVLWKTEVH